MKSTDAASRAIQRARRQSGVITAGELAREGISERLTARMVESGIFRRLHRGVLVLAGTPEDHALAIRTALAAVGPAAAASHQSAAWLHGLIERPPAVAHLTVLRDYGTKVRSVELHRCRSPFTVLRVQGVPCTNPLRTLVDLAATASQGLLDEAVDRALAERLIRPGDLDISATEVVGRTGVRRLRAAASYRGLAGKEAPTVLESRFRRLLARYGVPLPKPQVHAGPDGRYRIDYAYDDIRLALEAYGFAWHHTPEQLDHDLKRQNELVEDDWTVLVYTSRQITEEPQRVAEEVAGTYHRLRRSASRPQALGTPLARKTPPETPPAGDTLPPREGPGNPRAPRPAVLPPQIRPLRPPSHPILRPFPAPPEALPPRWIE